jgi:acetylornithine/succinyldiaminopimelate/putrescine aminotransferase
MPGFRLVPFDDIAALDRARRDETVAVMVEPIQGEGGVVVPRADYLKRMRDWCDRNKLLLILDEVQTGVGRTGRFFAYEHAGIKPDIVTLAKALGGGIPIGAMIARPEVASSFTPGSHGSTFGGNPVACAAALAVIDALEQDGVLDNASSVGGYLLERLGKFARSCDRIVEVRGLGMIIGVVLKHDVRPIVEECVKQRLLVNGTAGNVLRLLPPLNLSREEADTGLAIIENAFKSAPAPK